MMKSNGFISISTLIFGLIFFQWPIIVQSILTYDSKNLDSATCNGFDISLDIIGKYEGVDQGTDAYVQLSYISDGKTQMIDQAHSYESPAPYDLSVYASTTESYGDAGLAGPWNVNVSGAYFTEQQFNDIAACLSENVAHFNKTLAETDLKTVMPIQYGYRYNNKVGYIHDNIDSIASIGYVPSVYTPEEAAHASTNNKPQKSRFDFVCGGGTFFRIELDNTLFVYDLPFGPYVDTQSVGMIEPRAGVIDIQSGGEAEGLATQISSLLSSCKNSEGRTLLNLYTLASTSPEQ